MKAFIESLDVWFLVILFCALVDALQRFGFVDYHVATHIKSIIPMSKEENSQFAPSEAVIKYSYYSLATFKTRLFFNTS
jgi:hypothetical protein